MERLKQRRRSVAKSAGNAIENESANIDSSIDEWVMQAELPEPLESEHHQRLLPSFVS
tara:strand:+ start:248 stop:421 length:174 start_codon:yes stop_codon:yes gene_type:complete